VATRVHERKNGGTVKVTDDGHPLTYVGDSLLFVGFVPAKADIAYEECGSIVDPVDDDELL